MKKLILATLFIPLLSLAKFERVDRDIKEFDDRIQKHTTEFEQTPAAPENKSWVKEKLNFMYMIDQDMRLMWQTPFRKTYNLDETKYFNEKFLSRNNQIDSQNTADLKELLKIYQWFKISEFGEQAESQAWIIVQHADLDPAFQKSVLAILTDLWPQKETQPKNYAYLFDRVAASWFNPANRTLQRYGTQGECLGPKNWQPLAMEEPQLVDVRRAQVGLGPLDDYKNMAKEMCR